MIEDRSTKHRKRGFTRVDLLLALAMALLLVVIALPTLANTKSSSQAAVCRNNLRRLIQAWNMYADNNNGRLVPNFGTDAFGNQSGPTWSDGWNGLTSGLGSSGIDPDPRKLVYPELTGGQTGLLEPYLTRDATVFKCPADERMVTIFGRLISPPRSVSMNNWMSGTTYQGQTGFKVFQKRSDITRPEPTRTLVFIEESADSIIDGVFSVDMISTLAAKPADYHDGGANLSFADGHVEYRNWKDPRTVARIQRGVLVPIGPMVGNADLDFLRSVATAPK